MHVAYLFSKYLSVLSYLCQGSSVFAGICLALCVCSSEKIQMKFPAPVDSGTRKR